MSARNREAGIGRVDVTDHGFGFRGNLAQLGSSGSCLWLAVIHENFLQRSKAKGGGTKSEKDDAPLPRLAMWKKLQLACHPAGVLIFIFTILQIRKLADRGVRLVS